MTSLKEKPAKIPLTKLEESERKYKAKIFSVLLDYLKLNDLEIPEDRDRERLLEEIFQYLIKKGIIQLYKSETENLTGSYGPTFVDKSFYICTAKN